MKPFSLIIFDCDGTLVDTERVGNQVIVEQLGSMGHSITLDEALATFAGRKMADTLALIEQRIGTSLPPAFLEELRDHMSTAFEERLETMAGVPHVLEFLRVNGVPSCVASNGPFEKMKISLGVTGLLPYFEDRIFSAYECQAWKPDPEIFLFAAEKMGHSPSKCAVVEDSAFGVRAGVAAGMTVFGYAPRHDGRDLEALGAHVFHRMDELPERLNSLK